MKLVDLYGRVCYAVRIEEISSREAARRFGIDHRTVAKMLSFSVPPGYRRTQLPARPRLDAFVGIIDRILQEDHDRIHFFAMDLPHSDAGFVQAYPAETMAAFCAGHVSAFAFFGGVPASILYDNTRLAVARILGDVVRRGWTGVSLPAMRHVAVTSARSYLDLLTGATP